MSFNGLRLEYALEGTSKFCAWKDIMEVVLDDNGVLEYTQSDMPKPTASDAQQLAQGKKDIAKARRIILEGLRGHMVLILHGKKIAYEMWKTLIKLVERSDDVRKMALKDMLRNI